ncbi:MAG TPA: aspartate aminotransferase family protein [Solirubrobacteraceae bacterium]|nr:aspartate aminotransferase family protein [Solirubrobacteraceae bacterium]
MLTDRTYALDASAALYRAAREVIAGGVGSNDRGLVHPHPIFVARGAGSRIWDVDGNEYIDYLLAYGPLILGHAHPEIVTAVQRQLSLGSVYGIPHRLESEVGELLAEVYPSIEMVRYSSSGTEAVLGAMRLARAATGRKLIVKFEGQYHGWLDQVAISYAPSAADAGPADAPAVVPVSEGQPEGTYADTIVAQWNDSEGLERLFAERGGEIAAILTEPLMCNFGVIEPVPGYLARLRELCDRFGAVLIFDEIQTGFRVHLSGVQGLYGVTPDLTCLGKALSGGFPISAVGGRRDIMELIADRRVFHAGTYNSNPLCLAAIPAVVSVLSEPGVYERMESLSGRLREGLAELLRGVGGYVQGTNTMFGIGFGPGPGSRMRELWHNDPGRIFDLKKELRLRGIYTKPTPRDIWYVSTAHTEDDVSQTLDRAHAAIAALPT